VDKRTNRPLGDAGLAAFDKTDLANADRTLHAARSSWFYELWREESTNVGKDGSGILKS
jgi:hypothetical protein